MANPTHSRFDPPARPGRSENRSARHLPASSWDALAQSSAAVEHSTNRLCVAIGSGVFALPPNPPSRSDWTLPSDIAEFLIVARQYYDICKADKGDTPESDVLFDRREAIRAVILARPPRTIGDVLARAIMAAERSLIYLNGTWPLDDKPSEEVALSLLQVAGMTDGRCMRGIVDNPA